jgi:hypothetical protein
MLELVARKVPGRHEKVKLCFSETRYKFRKGKHVTETFLTSFSGFRREAAENRFSGSLRNEFTNPMDGTERLSRNVGKKLPLLAE